MVSIGPPRDMDNPMSRESWRLYISPNFYANLLITRILRLSVVQPALIAYRVFGHIRGNPLHRKRLVLNRVGNDKVRPLRYERRGL